MLTRAVWVALALVVIGTSNVAAHAADVAVTADTPDGPAPGAAVQTAPGGGDMVILAPESRYVTRAWRDGTGRVHGECGRGHGDAVVHPTGRAQP